MDCEKIQLNSKQEENIIWVIVVFVNQRVKAKVYLNESFQELMQRIACMMQIEQEYVLALKPMSKEVANHSQEEEKRILKPSATKKNKNTKNQPAEYSFEDISEEEEGQIHIPKDVVLKIKDLRAEQSYLVCYLRLKTDQEITTEQQELRNEYDQEEDGERSNRFSPLRQLRKRIQRTGLNLDDQFLKAKKVRGDKRLLICPFVNCLKDFTETGNLKTHLRTHTGERPFVCSSQGCNKQFITKGHLKTHELIHSGDKPFVCNTCNKSYSRSGRLKIHIRTHTGEKPFQCNVVGCGKTFTEKGNLKTHMRIHSGEKPFQCSFKDCLKTFTTQGHLTDHMRRHSGERPFKCHYCQHAFMRSSTLKIHLRRHTGERPYVCQDCGKKFSESGNLKTHQKTHIYKKKRSGHAKKPAQDMIQQQQQKVQMIKIQAEEVKAEQQTISLGKRKRIPVKQQSQPEEIIVPQQLAAPNKRVKTSHQETIKIDSIENQPLSLEKEPQVEAKQEIDDTMNQNQNFNPAQENESLTLNLDQSFMQIMMGNESAQSPNLFNNQQTFNPQNFNFTPKIVNTISGGGGNFNSTFGYQSPMSFTPFTTANNPSFTFPLSLGGYQSSSNGNGNQGQTPNNNYQPPQKVHRNPSNKPSFQNFFAQLQQNQNVNQMMPSTNNSTLALNPNAMSPTSKLPFNFAPMSPTGNQFEPFASGFFSPDSKRTQLPPAAQYTNGSNTMSNTLQHQSSQQLSSLQHTQPQSSYQYNSYNNNNSNSQISNSNNPSQLPKLSSTTLSNLTPNDKFKQINSFNGMAGIQEINNQQKAFQSPPLQGTPFQNSFPNYGPMSKQNSSNNLLPLTLPPNKFTSEKISLQHKDSTNQMQFIESISAYGLPPPTTNKNADSQTYRQLQKSHSLSNLFTGNNYQTKTLQKPNEMNYQIQQQMQQQQQVTLNDNGSIQSGKQQEEESFSSMFSKVTSQK